MTLRVFFIVNAGALRATGVSDVARATLDDSAGRKRPFRARAETTEARNGVVKRRPHRCSPARVRTRGNRADQGARLIRGIGQKSVVRIFGSSISLASKDVRGATGESSDDSSHATCDTFAYRYRKMSVFDAP